jgi:hypothetical protein
MAIALTTQPTTDGLYSAYLPVKFVATETTNDPAYLEFELKTQAGASIPNVPKYRALNVNNTFTFDASNYLKSILNVFTTQGYSTTAIEHLDDLYGKYEVEVTDPINGVTALTSNEFYAFANIDGLRYSNDQTANDGINRKGMLYGSELSGINFSYKYQGEYDRCVIFVPSSASFDVLRITTYNATKPNGKTPVKQYAYIDVASWQGRLISVPLNRTFLNANCQLVFTPYPPQPFSTTYKGFRVQHNSLGRMYYYVEDRCKVNEFMFINRYGVKENIKFETYDYESVKTSSESYLVGGYTHTGNTNYFNTSANNVKVNQSIVEDYEVRGNFFTSRHKGELQDFVSSPLQWVVDNGELRPINVLDGSFKLVQKSRGIDFNFKYRYAQTKPSFK